MTDADDLGPAVAGFRRAEVALAAIVADADRLVDARTEVEQARDELKVVAGALVGLATAHRDLVGQLGEAAAALNPAERRDEERLIVALRESEGARAQQVAEVADAVEELARRLDRALAERIGEVVAQLAAGLPTAAQLELVAGRLDELARADRFAALADRLDELPSAAQLTALADRLDQVEELATAAQLETVAGTLAGVARADQVASVAERLDQLVTTSDLEAMELRLRRTLGPETVDAPQEGRPSEEVAELAARTAAMAVEEQVEQLIEQVHAGQRRVHWFVLAVAVSFLLFAALVSVLALQ